MPGPNRDRGEDSVAWNCTGDGSFTNASAYVMLLDTSLKNSEMPFKWIWSLKGPERVRIHLWKMAHEALITNSRRVKRQLAESACCPMCGDVEETVLHAVRDCNRMVQVWSSINEGSLPQSFFADNMEGWLRSNLKSNGQRRGLKWPLLFGTVVHLAWQARNDLIFRHISLSLDQMVRRIWCQATAYSNI